MTKIVLIAIAFFIYYYWVFSSTGAILAEVLKIRTKNIYFGMIMGFFFYFAVISFLLITLELITDLRYIILVYSLLSINILYSLFLLLFIRYWFNINLWDWNHAIFFVAFGVFMVLYYLKNYFISPSGLNITNTYILSFYQYDSVDNNIIFKLNPDVIVGNARALASLSWFTNVSVWFVMTGIDPSEIIWNLLNILDAMLFASIFVTLLSNFANKKSNRFLIGLLSLLVLSASKLLIYYFGYDSWHPQNMLTSLFFVTFILMTIYTNEEYRSRNMPWIIGIIFSSYITFEWDASYIMLFIIYVSTWITMLKYQTNFLKDMVKFTLFPTLCFIFYNAQIKNFLLIFIFLGLFLLMLILSILLYRNYSRVHDIELMMYVGRKKLLFVVPFIFTLISVVVVLATGENNLNFWTLENIASALYVQLELMRFQPWTNIVFLIISFVLLWLALIWLLFFEQIPNFAAKTPINMLSLLTVTFFNPLVGRFLILIFNEQALLNNATVFIVALLVALNISVYALRIKPFKKWHLKKPTMPPHNKQKLRAMK
ncbi:hypothetical protein D6D54_05915 [Spiroplasma poulsonii]|uniref:Transmembrane protein n=1 Tax=Spiroplasma poulsonii TaxID=2138 RepID=A0A3S0UMF2_9MOLU|nr:hypothetical protein [Spiroplasma poulsonii]MBW3058737.1 hypothetical protein [Spiroplasma poulsonii]RUP76564.1 hypothetical protein D6D54_05915 [Spiroplasma poulsonii]